MSPTIRLVLHVLADGADDAEALRSALTGCEDVQVDIGPERQLWSAAGLDAVFVAAPVAERWGAGPAVYTAQILRTKRAEMERGLPEFVIAGMSADPSDTRPAVELFALALQKLRDAMETLANAYPSRACWHAGSTCRHLGLEKVGPGALAALIKNEWCGANT